MPALAGNNHASKWTLEKTQEVLTQIEKQSRLYGMDFLYEVLDKVCVSRHTWQYWYKKWADNEDIIERMLLVDQYFEVRILKGAATKQINIGFATMLLKSKYGYVEERWRYNKRKSAEESEE